MYYVDLIRFQIIMGLLIVSPRKFWTSVKGVSINNEINSIARDYW